MSSATGSRVLVYEPRVEGHHLGFLRLVTEDLLGAGYAVALAVDRRDHAMRRINEEMPDLLPRVAVLGACDDRGRPAAGTKLATIAQCRDKVAADIAFLPNFDEIASAMMRRAAIGLMPPQTLRGRLSGIYHRPTFLWKGGVSLNGWLKHRGFMRLLRSGWLRHLLLFDTDARLALNERCPQAALFDIAVPFPGDFSTDRNEARRALGLPDDRRIFLFYGGAYKRKGLQLALDAMLSLPSDSPAFLLCAGEQADRGSSSDLDVLVNQRRAQVIDRYVSTEEEKQLFAAADAVLMPYRRHFAPSGVLARAVGAERPVIASDEYLVGRFVRQHELGIVVPSDDVVALRAAIERIARAQTPDLVKWQGAARALAPHWSRAAFREALLASFDPAARSAPKPRSAG